MISGATANLPEERVGDLDASNKYRNVDDLSDDDEEAMDISSSDSEAPSRKRARTNNKDAAGDSVPKWSNPDPYTALPCPDESQRKKKDVVKLIRKARLEEAKPAAATEAEDFISFLSDEEESEDSEDSDDEVPPPPEELPPPPPTSAPPAAPPTASTDFPAPPPAAAPAAPPSMPSVLRPSNSLSAVPSSLPPKPDQSGPLGSRKRSVDDVIKPPDYGQLRKVNMKAPKGEIMADWLPKGNEDPCPWATVDHSATSDMAFRYVFGAADAT